MRPKVERWRRVWTFLAAAIWLFTAAVTDSRWGEESPLGLVLFSLGCLLTGVGCLGRVWCLAFIAGQKTGLLVTDGPYSLCRNPLYLFSLLAAVGVGFASCTISIPLLVLVGFGTYYPSVMNSESRRLAETFGDTYRDYSQTTPALMPAFGRFHESAEHVINSRAFRRGVFDAFWFFVAFAAMHAFSELHHSGVIPAWYSLP
jgi:protein-S-isoprenylcysteine O-methyltransferase Ste14